MRRRLSTDRSGGVAIEFGFLALPLFLLFIGAFEFGRAYWTRNLLQFAVEEAGRYAIANITATTTQVGDVVRAKLTGYGLSAQSVTVVAAKTTVSGVNVMAISVSYPYTFATPLIPIPSVTLSSQANVPLLL